MGGLRHSLGGGSSSVSATMSVLRPLPPVKAVIDFSMFHALYLLLRCFLNDLNVPVPQFLWFRGQFVRYSVGNRQVL